MLCVKDNHPNFKKDIEDFTQDISLQNTMQSVSKSEKNHGRIETRTAFVTTDIGLSSKKNGKILKAQEQFILNLLQKKNFK